jgi:hypothetical protein
VRVPLSAPSRRMVQGTDVLYRSLSSVRGPDATHCVWGSESPTRLGAWGSKKRRASSPWPQLQLPATPEHVSIVCFQTTNWLTCSGQYSSSEEDISSKRPVAHGVLRIPIPTLIYQTIAIVPFKMLKTSGPLSTTSAVRLKLRPPGPEHQCLCPTCKTLAENSKNTQRPLTSYLIIHAYLVTKYT